MVMTMSDDDMTLAEIRKLLQPEGKERMFYSHFDSFRSKIKEAVDRREQFVWLDEEEYELVYHETYYVVKTTDSSLPLGNFFYGR
jgi:hypothetical protein